MALSDSHMRAVLGAALSDLVTSGLGMFADHARAIRQDVVADSRGDEQRAEARQMEDDDSRAAGEAAALLCIDVDATTDVIRSALRARLTETGCHPDHGGELEAAKRLIAAKNLLVERARSRQ